MKHQLDRPRVVLKSYFIGNNFKVSLIWRRSGLKYIVSVHKKPKLSEFDEVTDSKSLDWMFRPILPLIFDKNVKTIDYFGMDNWVNVKISASKILENIDGAPNFLPPALLESVYKNKEDYVRLYTNIKLPRKQTKKFVLNLAKKYGKMIPYSYSIDFQADGMDVNLNRSGDFLIDFINK